MRSAAHLEEQEADLGAVRADRDEDGLVVGGDQEDGAVLALDVDLGELAAAEALGRALAERQQGGAHGGDAVLVHGGRQGGGHGQAVEGDDGGGLELWGLPQQVVQDLVELRPTALATDPTS